MRKLRSVIGYFERSTQASTKLLNFQDDSGIEEYSNSQPKKLIQDVVTRWWSTYSSIQRALYLDKAVMDLLATKQVECEALSPKQWNILEQIENVLQPLAFFQRLLEGDSYVTGSMVPSAVFHIRRLMNEKIDDKDTDPSVRDLAKALLTDFETRFVPNESDSSKLTFSWGACIGFRKRYTTVHHYFFVAAFLDPRVKQKLQTFMTEDDYTKLKKQILLLMIAEADEMGDRSGRDNDKASLSPKLQRKAAPTDGAKKSAKAAQVSRMFDDDPSNQVVVVKSKSANANPLSVQIKCEGELSAFMDVSVMMPLNDDEGNYTNPLDWWRIEAKTYPVLASLAKFYLAIPATSAPSERIFSRAGRILTMRRASLSSDVVQRMLFIRENAGILRKHYAAIAKEELRESSTIKDEKYLLPLPPKANGGK